MSTPYTLEWALESGENMDSWLEVNNSREVIKAIKNHQNKQPEHAIALKDFMCAIVQMGTKNNPTGIAQDAQLLTNAYIAQLNK